MSIPEEIKVGWVGEGNDQHPDPVYTPDMAALIDGEEAPEETDFSVAAEIMRGVFTHVFDANTTSGAAPRLDVAFRRFVCVVWLLRPELLGNTSLAKLAPQLSVTRVALSAMIRKFGDHYGIRNVFQKREGAREIYAQAQRKQWRHRKKQEPVASEETTGPDTTPLNNGTHNDGGSV